MNIKLTMYTDYYLFIHAQNMLKIFVQLRHLICFNNLFVYLISTFFFFEYRTGKNEGFSQNCMYLISKVLKIDRQQK